MVRACVGRTSFFSSPLLALAMVSLAFWIACAKHTPHTHGDWTGLTKREYEITHDCIYDGLVGLGRDGIGWAAGVR